MCEEVMSVQHHCPLHGLPCATMRLRARFKMPRLRSCRRRDYDVKADWTRGILEQQEAGSCRGRGVRADMRIKGTLGRSAWIGT